MSNESLITQLFKRAQEIGFDLIGVTPAVSADSFNHFQEWIDAGKYAGMTYLAKHRDAHQHPMFVLDGVQSLIVVGISYEKTKGLSISTPIFSQGRIAAYALGADYHVVLRQKLRLLEKFHQELFPKEKTRIAVDTIPLLEREFAQKAGLGWLGKNTMLISESLGNRFFIGTLLSTAKLPEVSQKVGISYCGSCQKCIEACPTRALVAPYVLDANRCINYWTIEHHGEIPLKIREKMNSRLFGCDTCQTVCPFYQQQKNSSSSCCSTCLTDPNVQILTLEQLEAMSETEFENLFQGTSLFRTGLKNLKRNAKIIQDHS